MDPVTRNLVRGQNRSGGTIFGCQKLSAQTGNVSIIGPSVPKVVRGGYKCQTYSENAILDAMDSFSDEAGDLMEEVYRYMTQKHYPLGCMEG